MLVPLSWLREYVAVDAPLAELAERLSVSAAEVKAIERRGVPDRDGNLGLFKVGHVVEATRHPNADRLQLCHVDVGEGEPRQIVCGAWNFGAGATVAVALPGAVLPGGEKLERAKLRGAVSDGMILSERELELGSDHSGILLLDEAEPGTPLAEVLPLDDAVLELETTGNRPDLLSVYGVAREVAALYGAELAPMPGRDPLRGGDEPLDVTIADAEACPRYIGRRFRDVRVAASPPWLRARLSAAGMRPISNVVDVTNYVMLALGNPLHAFDYPTLAGGRIVVRSARPGERLRTLDGVERVFEERDLMIADGERAVAIAGIMGGEETEVTERTTDVLLEAANFEPIGLYRTSERLKLRTEGSNRWEKGVDPYLAEHAAKLATELIVELASARWVGHTDAQGTLPTPPVVRLRPNRASDVIGLDVPYADQSRLLGQLGFEPGPEHLLTVPTWRARDVTREIDVVEEIARFHLADVPFTLPLRRAMFGRLARSQRLQRTVEEALVGMGLSEVYTPSLVSPTVEPEGVRLSEPLTEELAVLRRTLLHGLLAAARHNVATGSDDIALFELARTYEPRGDGLPHERICVGAILEGSFARAKGVVETLYAALKAEPDFERAREGFLHPGKAARTDAGWVGELHPTLLEGTWSAFELDLETLFASAVDSPQYEDVITYPALKQDLAFVVGEDVTARALVDAAREAAGAELREMRVFDVYRGEQIGAGRKSVAFSVSFQSPERTLSDDDAAALRGRIVGELERRFGAKLRAEGSTT
ncbi:MAG: phenylalanine--tRNA ligase subunit beta [Actinomycetota bacterium]|nr:phenylalanine--tRNA ligase subunit beta [Actinomycetota bacterium]